MIAKITYSQQDLSLISKFLSSSLEEKSAYWTNEKSADAKALKLKIKKHYLNAQNYSCAYCRQKIYVTHSAAWDTEHILPRVEFIDFTFEPENLCVSCKDCNSEKGRKKVLQKAHTHNFPRSSSDYIIVHPHFDKYNDHINIIEPGLFYAPKTDKGRKTIEICGLLRFWVDRFVPDSNDPNLSIELIQVQTELSNSIDPKTKIFALSRLKQKVDRAISAHLDASN